MPENALPQRCPEGHHLAPGHYSRSWDMYLKRHRLYCTGCQGRSRILLEDGAEWEINSGGRWVTCE